jgi:hypothetical protein
MPSYRSSKSTSPLKSRTCATPHGTTNLRDLTLDERLCPISRFNLPLDRDDRVVNQPERINAQRHLATAQARRLLPQLHRILFAHP